LVIVDDPLFLAPLVTRAQDLGTPVVACCQNLESLSYRGQTSATPGRAFDREIAILSRCALVITISEWENEILQRHGVESFFFPYHPARHIEQRLKSIRSRRHHAFKGGLFTLGSVTNPGTRDGMITLIRTWGEKSRELKGQKLIVCGYGTEELRSTTSSPSVEVHGTVSDAELDDIITHSHGALSYQEYGGGSLTRVTELLTAGVPVVANPHAARDHRNSPGIISVRGISEVPEGVARAMRFGEFPPPTPPDLTSLRSMLDELACRPRPEEGASG
jgi:hypothetical protein